MKINIASNEVVHFIGIGGIGMSGLAQIMNNMGFTIQGSDSNRNKNTDRLIKIVQQCIMNQKSSIVDFYEKNNIENYIFEFDKNILKLVLSSNLAVTRCGSSTTAELAYTLTPFIAVPLPDSVDNHQYLNAKYYKDKGCCWILEQDNFNTKNLFNLIMRTIKNKNELKNICENMKKNCDRNVYGNIENEIKEFI